MIKENIQEISDNLSIAWAEAFLESIEPGVMEIRPLTITIAGFVDGLIVESPEIRYALDSTLADCGKFSTHTTANTIFPISLWNPDKDAQDLYDRYNYILPKLKKIEHQNIYGLYFERLVAYSQMRHNQLDFIIRTYKGGNHRRSALQAGIYDPLIDQRNQRQRGFPCLQQIAFIPDQTSMKLGVHGFYATQYLFERAYGNLLGLARLGIFVAHELGLEFSRLSCTASIAKYGNLPRGDLRKLADDLRKSLEIIKSD
jgi:hypothetical protein